MPHVCRSADRSVDLRASCSNEALRPAHSEGWAWTGSRPQQCRMSEGSAPTDDAPLQPAPPNTQEDHDQGDTKTKEEREAARVQRMNELMRKQTKAELLRIAYAGDLVNHNSPEK